MVSNIFYFHPYLGKWSNLTNIFQRGWNHQLENPWNLLRQICIPGKLPLHDAAWGHSPIEAAVMIAAAFPLAIHVPCLVNSPHVFFAPGWWWMYIYILYYIILYTFRGKGKKLEHFGFGELLFCLPRWYGILSFCLCHLFIRYSKKQISLEFSCWPIFLCVCVLLGQHLANMINLWLNKTTPEPEFEGLLKANLNRTFLLEGVTISCEPYPPWIRT